MHQKQCFQPVKAHNNKPDRMKLALGKVAFCLPSGLRTVDISGGKGIDCGPAIDDEKLSVQQVTLVGRGSRAETMVTGVKLTIKALTPLPSATQTTSEGQDDADADAREGLFPKLQTALAEAPASDGADGGAPAGPQGKAAFRPLPGSDVKEKLAKSSMALRQNGIQKASRWIEVMDPLANLPDEAKRTARAWLIGGRQGTTDKPAFVLGGGDPGIRTFFMIFDASTGKVYRIGHGLAAYLRGRLGLKRDHCISEAAKVVNSKEPKKHLREVRRLQSGERRAEGSARISQDRRYLPYCRLQ
ncbi:unnamed protein product [Chrysoparadoxa australica]